MKVCVAEMNKSEYFRTYKNELSWGYRFQRSVKNFFKQNKIFIRASFFLLIIVLIILGVLFPELPCIKEIRDILMKSIPSL